MRGDVLSCCPVDRVKKLIHNEPKCFIHMVCCSFAPKPLQTRLLKHHRPSNHNHKTFKLFKKIQGITFELNLLQCCWNQADFRCVAQTNKPHGVLLVGGKYVKPNQAFGTELTLLFPDKPGLREWQFVLLKDRASSDQAAGSKPNTWHSGWKQMSMRAAARQTCHAAKMSFGQTWNNNEVRLF